MSIAAHLYHFSSFVLFLCSLLLLRAQNVSQQSCDHCTRSSWWRHLFRLVRLRRGSFPLPVLMLFFSYPQVAFAFFLIFL